MAFDKTYDEYVKRTAGQGEAMSKSLFDKMKLEREAEEIPEKFKKEPEERGKIKYYMDNVLNPAVSDIEPLNKNQVGSSQSQTPQQQLLQPPQTPQQQLLQPPQPPQTPQNNIQQLQQQIAEAQKKNEIANLEQLYQKNVGGLTAERQKVDPLYAGQTRQAVAQGEMRKKSFSDFLAEKGLSASGYAGQGEISQNVAMQGQLGDIEARRGETMSDIERRLTETTQARDFGISGASTQADRYLAEQKLNQALRQQDIDREDALRQQAIQREDQLIQQGYTREDAQRKAEIERQDAIRQQDISREDTRYSQELGRSEFLRQQENARQDTLRQQAIAREDELRQQGFSREDAQNQAELERRQKEQTMQTEIGTIDRYANDYTAEINRRKATPDTADDALIPYLESAKTQKVQGIEQSKAQQAQAQATAQQKFAEAQYDKAMEIWKTSGVANDYVAQTLGVPKGARTSDNAYKQAQLALDKIRASKIGTGGSNNQMKISYSSALSQARQILGNNANAQQIDALARQLVEGTPLTNTNVPDLPKATPPTTNKATDVLKYLGKLEAAKDLTTINAFLNNNEAEFDRILKNPNSSDAEKNAVKEIRRLFNKYK